MNSANDSSKLTAKGKAALAAEFFGSGGNHSEQQAERERSAAENARIVECIATLSGRNLTTGPTVFGIALRRAQRQFINQASSLLGDAPDEGKRAASRKLVIDTARSLKAVIGDVDALYVTAVDAQKVAKQVGLSGTLPDRIVVLLALALLAVDRATSLAQDVTNQLGDPVAALSLATFLLQGANECGAEAKKHSAAEAWSAEAQRRRRSQTSAATMTAAEKNAVRRAELVNWVTPLVSGAKEESSAGSIALKALAQLDKAPASVRAHLNLLEQPAEAVTKIIRDIRRTAGRRGL